MELKSLQGKATWVLGLGISGRAAAQFLAAHGACVTGVDARSQLDNADTLRRAGISLRLGDDSVSPKAGDLVVLSPGVPPDRVHNGNGGAAEVMGEVELALGLLDPQRPVVAVTGTNGKSTTTSFVGQLLHAGGHDPFVGGNLGRPLIEAIGGAGPVVAELSSYQLETVRSLVARVGILTQLAPDHLARHGSFAAYAQAKRRVLDSVSADGLIVVPEDDPAVESLLEGLSAPIARVATRGRVSSDQGAWLDDKQAVLSLAGRSYRFSLDRFDLRGEHNRWNVLAACLAALHLGVSADALQGGIDNLTALPHRLQPIPTEDGVLWINDSKSTNAASTRTSFLALHEPTLLLLGGQGKDEDYDELATDLMATGRVVAVAGFGADGDALVDAFEAHGATGQRCADLAQAVDWARSQAQSGQAVLMSPACASFDAFDNFEHRGQAFVQMVLKGMSNGDS